MRLPSGVAIIAFGTSPSPAFGCILCDSPQAVSLRERLLQPDVWFNLGAVMLPILLLGAIVAWIARGPDGRGEAA